MAMRRSRSLSLFQPSLNSTATKLEGAVLYEDNEEDTKEPISNECDDLYLSGQNDDEGEDVFPNGQATTTGVYYKIEQLKSDLQFVESLQQYASEKKKKSYSYKKMLNGINVEKDNYLSSMSHAEVVAKFEQIMKSLGKFRTFDSAVHDMGIFLKKSLSKIKHPEEPVAPLQPRQLYLKEICAQGKTAPANTSFLKWASDCYNKLSVREKSRYIKKHEKMKENYLRQLEDFYERYPNERPILREKNKTITPFNLFYSELKSEHNYKRADALNQWNDLPVKKKIGFIKKAYQYQNENPNNEKVTITIKEKKLLDGHYGKPERPPLTVLSLYKNEHSDELDCHKGYKALKKKEKQQLKSKLCEMFQKYEKDMKKYISKLNGEAKSIEQDELLKFMSKYKDFSKPLAKQKRKRSASLGDNVEESVPKKKKETSSSSKDINYDQIDEITIKSEHEIVTKNRSPLKKATNVRETKKPQEKATQSHLEDEKPILNKEEGKKKDRTPKRQQREFTGVKPPKTLFKYFVSTNKNITLGEAKKKFRSLTKSQKKNIEKIYNVLCETYIVQLKEYLVSLKESDMKAFVKQLEKTKAAESDDDLTSSEDESVSDSE